jgi:hypothetical protein
MNIVNRLNPPLVGGFRGYLHQIVQQSFTGKTIHDCGEPLGTLRMPVECLMLQIPLIEYKSGLTHELPVLFVHIIAFPGLKDELPAATLACGRLMIKIFLHGLSDYSFACQKR